MYKDKNMPYTDLLSALDNKTLSSVSMAFKSLEKGTASPEQQKYALEFLIRIICRTYDSAFFKDERTTCFALGRQYVGMQIVDFINLKVGKLKP